MNEVHGFDQAPAAPAVLAPEIDSDDIRSLMASAPETLPVEDRPRTPNVYAALEQLDAEREAERAAGHQAGRGAAEPAPDAPAEGVAETLTHADRDAVWTALAPEPAAADDWTAQAEPVGPEVLRWRREDDDLIPTGPNGAGRRRLRLRRR